MLDFVIAAMCYMLLHGQNMLYHVIRCYATLCYDMLCDVFITSCYTVFYQNTFVLLYCNNMRLGLI